MQISLPTYFLHENLTKKFEFRLKAAIKKPMVLGDMAIGQSTKSSKNIAKSTNSLRYPDAIHNGD